MEGMFDADADVFVPAPIAAGPWSTKALHGGVPAGLVGRMIDRWENSDDQWRLTRLTVELLRPVPMAPLRVAIEPRRLGRRIQVLDAVLLDQTETARRRPPVGSS